MALIRLKGHEKFHLREGWITKGLFGVQNNPGIFTGNDGPDLLGVGSNMVKSIRHWMTAMGLLPEDQHKGAILTPMGELIAAYDAYTEDFFTLWLLHSHIAKNEGRATAWYLFFNKCGIDEFTKDEVYSVLKKELIAYAGTDKFPETSLKDDLDVLLNMYSKEKIVDDPEDKNRCPLAVLNLIHRDGDLYSRLQPDMRYFPDDVLLYELGIALENSQSVSIEQIAELAGSIYHLTRVTVNNILDRLDNIGYITVNRTAGLDEVYKASIGTPGEIIENYYARQVKTWH